MRLREFIERSVREYLNETSKGDVMRDVLSDKFKKEEEISYLIITNQNKAQYEIILFLIGLGFYENTEYNIHYRKNSQFKPSLSDYVGSIKIIDFIKEHKKYLSKKNNVSIYSIRDEMWDDSFENTIKLKIVKILKKYGFELDNNEPFLYGHGDLLIKLKVPNEIEYAKKYPQIIMKNPNKVITSKEFLGIEDRYQKRKFIKHFVDGYEYKFLLNPLNQDKYFSSGDKGIFGGLFGGILKDFLHIKDFDFKNVILQIHKNYKNYNFVIGGDGFYNLEDVKKYEENEDFNIKKIDKNHVFYKKLVDLNELYKKLNDIKMIVFIDIGGDLNKTKNGGLVDKNSNTIYYSYILKK